MAHEQTEHAINSWYRPPQSFLSGHIQPACGIGASLPSMGKKPSRTRRHLQEETKIAICLYHKKHPTVFQKRIGDIYNIDRRYAGLYERTCPVSILTFV